MIEWLGGSDSRDAEHQRAFMVIATWAGFFATTTSLLMYRTRWAGLATKAGTSGRPVLGNLLRGISLAGLERGWYMTRSRIDLQGSSAKANAAGVPC